MNSLISLGERGKTASLIMKTASTMVKNKGLYAIAEALSENMAEIIAANTIDIDNAKTKGISQAMIDRLTLTEKRILDIKNAVIHIIELSDPVGDTISGGVMPNGLKIINTRVPFGLIGIIYEARPNVTVDAACLCIKSGNCCILRGGSEAINSNKAIVKTMRDALSKTQLPQDCVLLVENTSRETATELMTLKGYIDLLIPRGGAGLIKSVVENANVPVIETGVGNCHTFIDSTADIIMAVEIAVNAKVSRPSVCNSMETLLVHKDIAQQYLPLIKEELLKYNVEIRGCDITRSIISRVIPATELDYATEFSDYILAIKVVNSLSDAISHINKFTSGHSECIITESYKNSIIFTQEIDCAAVYVNASTRFTDGGEFGYGAEIGISTQKLHARGPMGLSSLTTNKFIVNGMGQIR